MLDISSGIHDISSLRWELAGCLLLAWVIVYLALWRGIKSIGKVCTGWSVGRKIQLLTPAPRWR